MAHLLWIGPLTTFLGGVSYFVYFAAYPALRDVPWVNLPLVLLGLVLTLVGCLGTWRKGRRRVLAAAAGFFSLLVSGLFCWYVFSFSYGLPEPTATSLALDVAPDFTLPDQDGKPVTLSTLRGQPVLLTFYRGHW